jgi:RNA-directed DNA polymerase
MTYGRGKSDGRVVPAKPANAAELRRTLGGQGDPYTGTQGETPDTAKGEPTADRHRGGDGAESVEGRRPAEGNTDRQNAPRTQSRTRAHSALDRVRRVAARQKDAKFTALLHHVTADRLREAFQSLKRNAAPGVDGVTWEHYARDLEGNLQDLHARVHRGAYRAKPSRRVYIPKADGRQRPLGIAALEDKIVQRAVVEVMNAIYEVDFLGFSYGFRPGRNQHQALDALAVGLLRKKVNWVLDADIRGFFDAIDHGCLMKFVAHRIADRRVLRLIRKWLKAGVMEGDEWRASAVGSPQGATVSPLLANVYLHYVFDLWIRHWRSRYARGDVMVVRYADDVVVGFQYRSDATRFGAELDARLSNFALELHPQKTRLVEFGRYAAERRAEKGMGKPETFDFLGLTHICGKTRAGDFLLVRHTSRKRMAAKLRWVRGELMRRRHLSIKKQGLWLQRVVGGYFNYHAMPTNIGALQQFRKQVTRHWHSALRRRSQKDRTSWQRTARLADRWLPTARIQHPWPNDRFDARTRGGSPVR